MLSGVLIRPARPVDVPGIITLFTAVAAERDSIGTEPGFDVAQRQSSILKSVEEAASCVLVAAAKTSSWAIWGSRRNIARAWARWA